MKAIDPEISMSNAIKHVSGQIGAINRRVSYAARLLSNHNYYCHGQHRKCDRCGKRWCEEHRVVYAYAGG